METNSLKEETKTELNDKPIPGAGILTFLCTPKRENTHFANPLLKCPAKEHFQWTAGV